MHTPHYNELRKASEILRQQMPGLKIGHTIDVYPELKTSERQILFMSDRMKTKRLLQINPR